MRFSRVPLQSFTSFIPGLKAKLRLGGQYSYLSRDAWSGIGGQPEAVENMIYSSFRYYIP